MNENINKCYENFVDSYRQTMQTAHRYIVGQSILIAIISILITLNIIFYPGELYYPSLIMIWIISVYFTIYEIIWFLFLKIKFKSYNKLEDNIIDFKKLKKLRKKIILVQIMIFYCQDFVFKRDLKLLLKEMKKNKIEVFELNDG